MVKTNAFLWAAVVVIIGLDDHLALPAAIVGLVLALAPALFAPRAVPVRDEHGHHDGRTYKLLHPGQTPFPVNPKPGDNPSYTPGSWS